MNEYFDGRKLMGVYIKGMKMPQNCEECDVKVVCKNYWKLIREQHTRPSWCPLISISPHCRLVDVDALEVHDGWMNEDRERNVQQTHITFVYSNDIANAPTIIEAEGEA